MVMLACWVTRKVYSTPSLMAMIALEQVAEAQACIQSVGPNGEPRPEPDRPPARANAGLKSQRDGFPQVHVDTDVQLDCRVQVSGRRPPRQRAAPGERGSPLERREHVDAGAELVHDLRGQGDRAGKHGARHVQT